MASNRPAAIRLLEASAAATLTCRPALLAGHGDKDNGGMIRIYEDALGVRFREDSVAAAQRVEI